MRDDITHLQRRSDEMPILLANSHAGCRGSLLNPTAIANGWAPMLGPPNPTTRDELFEFTGEHFKFLYSSFLFMSSSQWQMSNVLRLQPI
jgi:hypothetical protein